MNDDRKLADLNPERKDLFNYYALKMLKIQGASKPTAAEIMRMETLFIELFKFHAEKILDKLKVELTEPTIYSE